MPYHLEVLETPWCNNRNLVIFSRAHMTYINQIFGDETIRDIIQEVFPREGKLVIEPAGANFEHSVHHVFYADGSETPTHELNEERPWNFATSKICSLSLDYQDLEADHNDTLCQSYSLMAFLEVDFDSTPSKNATIEMKFNKQRSMINMYRQILDNPDFIAELDAIVKNKRNKKLWEDTVDDENPFFIIQRFKTTENVVKTIRRVLDIWEHYGWRYFVGDGTCEKLKKEGGARKTRRRRRQ
jgi:hypothetical protein